MSVEKRLILEQARNTALTARMDVMRAEQAMKLAEDNVRVSELVVENTQLRMDVQTLTEERDQHAAEVARLREALGFYANPQNYGLHGGTCQLIYTDAGKLAKAALT